MYKKIPQIKELAEKYRDYTSNNLSNLIKIKSLSTKEEGVCNLIEKMLHEADFDEVRIDTLGNVIGRIGNGQKKLAIDAHIDTVDSGNLENWTKEPFSGLVSDEFVFGRGSVDQKSGAAAMITAGRILKEIKFDRDLTIYFTFTVMEEDCDGLCWKYIIEQDKIMPDYVILTEPTNCNIYRGHRGRMEMNVIFNGVSSHGSAPERGVNAIYMASKICLEIEKLNERFESDDFLGKGSITVTEFVSGSPSLCAVADYAKIHLDRRLTWGETQVSAVNEIEDLIKGQNAEVKIISYREKAYTGLLYGMEKYYPTWKLEENHFAVQTGIKVCKNLFGTKPLIDKWTFSTNGVVINGIYKIPVIGFGPGNEEMAHAPNEKVPIDDLVKASAFYAGYACLI